MPRALAMMVGIPLVGRLYNKVQPRILVVIGVVLVALSAYLMTHYTLDDQRALGRRRDHHPGGRLRVAVRAADDGRAGAASRATGWPTPTGLNSLLRQIGGSLGLAVFATLLPRFVADRAQRAWPRTSSPGRPEVIAAPRRDAGAA